MASGDGQERSETMAITAPRRTGRSIQKSAAPPPVAPMAIPAMPTPEMIEVMISPRGTLAISLALPLAMTDC